MCEFKMHITFVITVYIYFQKRITKKQTHILFSVYHSLTLLYTGLWYEKYLHCLSALGLISEYIWLGLGLEKPKTALPELDWFLKNLE